MRLAPTLGVTLPALLLSFSFLTPVLGERTAQQIVQDANRLLSEGSYLEASRAYTEAIDLDPSSYINYYKRATVYLSLGRHNAALDDFDTIIRLYPAFGQAHYQKAKILAKEGRFAEAQVELREFGKDKKLEADAEDLERSLEYAIHATEATRKAAKASSWQVCVDEASRALEVGPNSAELRELRVECNTHLGQAEAVYGDLTRLATLNPSIISLPLRLSHLSYFLLGSSAALTHIKQCLHYDPDSKPCKKVHKLLRSLEKDTAKVRNFVEGGTHRSAVKILEGEDGLLARFEKALQDATTAQADGTVYIPAEFNAMEKSQGRLELYGLACKAAVGLNDFKKDRGVKWCEEALRLDENNVDGWVSRGEVLLKEEKWDEGLRALEKAFELTGKSSQEVLNRVQKAQRLLKVSKQKDYYKVIGVPRDADERTIKKAFRKKAKTVHPDVGGSEEQMAALNEAYEVLTNEDLRRRYDNGDDPNDPQGGQGGNPFAHHGGGMPFQFFQQGGGGGGFQGFKQQQGGRQFQFNWG